MRLLSDRLTFGELWLPLSNLCRALVTFGNLHIVHKVTKRTDGNQSSQNKAKASWSYLLFKILVAFNKFQQTQSRSSALPRFPTQPSLWARAEPW